MTREFDNYRVAAGSSPSDPSTVPTCGPDAEHAGLEGGDEHLQPILDARSFTMMRERWPLMAASETPSSLAMSRLDRP